MRRGRLVDMAKALELIEREIRGSFQEDNLLSIILFGSAVHSIIKAADFDILIVTKKLPPRDWIVAGKIKSALLGKTGKPVDFILIEEADLGYGSPFLYEVAQKNKVLWGKNVLPRIRETVQGITPIMRRGKKIGWKIAQ